MAGHSTKSSQEGPLLASPPPYSPADAYPRVRVARRLRKVFSLPVGLAVLLTCAITWLCFLLQREMHLRAVAQNATGQRYVAEFEASMKKCAALQRSPERIEPAVRKTNPRWNAVTGQNGTVILRNATLFDGEDYVSGPVDIVFEKGIITDVSPTTTSDKHTGKTDDEGETVEYNLHGQFVTPGLVDMHSHHLLMIWPFLEETDDTNEIHKDFGPLTPYVRAIDGIKPYDAATARIASGGVTTSLLIPGSANIMGGEGTVVKNLLFSGPNREPVVEELLLEHGIPEEERHRYIKLACGENPKRVYGHTRMGNAWVLRKHLARAKELLEKQDAWCEAAASLDDRRASSVAEKKQLLTALGGGYPEDLELDSTIGLLRGRVSMQNHCYEPEDFETMLRISEEFGFRVKAFHHAIAAWEVPEFLKAAGHNVTVATFAEFSLYKAEAYRASLYAGHILNEHGVSVAYKSDHAGGETNAQYLLSQATIARYFKLPPVKALQSVTSIPAKAIDLDYRVGYVRPGYDADIVVWDSNPLSIGAVPRQVFIDGVATLEPVKVKQSIDDWVARSPSDSVATEDLPVRMTIAKEQKRDVCGRADKQGRTIVVSGIQKSLVEKQHGALDTTEEGGNFTLIVKDGTISCFGANTTCVLPAGDSDAVHIELANGYLAPGLTAVSGSLGLTEILMAEGAGDGAISPLLDPKRPSNVDFAKYGVTLDGKAFVRARLGGVTRAITAPLSLGGLVQGVSTGILTSGKRSLLDGGIFQPDVALHVGLGNEVKVAPGAVSFAIQELREILEAVSKGATKEEEGAAAAKGEDAMIHAQVAKGAIPLVIHAISKHATEHAILLKKDFPKVKIVLLGGESAPYFAKELAEAEVPVILTAHRPDIFNWGARDALPGPPLSRSPASILSEAGVLYAIAIGGGPPAVDSRIHDLAFEASWAAKFAGLGERDAIRLVSRNVEEILGLEPSRDIVVWEGSPLQFGTPVLALQDGAGDGTLEVATCWPDEREE